MCIVNFAGKNNCAAILLKNGGGIIFLCVLMHNSGAKGEFLYGYAGAMLMVHCRTGRKLPVVIFLFCPQKTI